MQPHLTRDIGPVGQGTSSQNAPPRFPGSLGTHPTVSLFSSLSKSPHALLPNRKLFQLGAELPTPQGLKQGPLHPERPYPGNPRSGRASTQPQASRDTLDTPSAQLRML